MTAAIATKQPVFQGRQLKTYVDPHPGRANSDRVSTDCGRCGGSGNVGIYWVEGGVCFECRGSGRGSITVGTARKWARVDALARDYAEEIKAEQEAAWAAERAATLAAEIAADHAVALAMNARRDAAVQGFVAEEGTNVKAMGLAGEVVIAKPYETHFGYGTQTGIFMIIKLDNGQVIKTSGSGNTLFGLERGDRVAIIGGSVRAHEHYEGQDQTVLIRAKLERIEQEEVAA